MKRALITGITGQDGSYLAEFLLEKGYEVHGLYRRTSTDPCSRIEPLVLQKKITLHKGSLHDLGAITRAVEKSYPDEVYNLGAQSHVGDSFECPTETKDINEYGVERLVDAAMKVNPKVRIYQASTSEMFGSTLPPQNENSPFNPVSPYAQAKLEAHERYVVGYRKEYGLFICSGILFNHESPRRGKQFVTRKITHSLVKVKLGLQDCLELGNVKARRDWGFAGDYVKAMWMMLQRDEPEDFVIATGADHTVEEFVELVAHFLDMDIMWSGGGPHQVGRTVKEGKAIVKVNPEFFRPSEVNHLLGDANKAYRELGWQPEVEFEELVEMMVKADLELVRRTTPQTQPV